MTSRTAHWASVLLLAAIAGCSSAPTSPEAGGTTSTSPTSASTPTSTTQATSPTPSASASASATSMEAVGEQMGAKIAFYAVAKAAGMDDSAKMDELASGICSRIESNDAGAVGPWMEDAFQLEGDVAAKVAVMAIEFQCPEFKSMMGL